ncbi:MAG: MerR family transcriptional regulator [Acidobacteriota bacterium]|nr:MerR family transcriptional regulator [Acidobacteriota bacterium]
MDDSTLLSIKEFANFTGVSQSRLRYYDDIGILLPALRGENNYRYYTPSQIIALNFVSVLIDLGIPLSTIKDLLHNRTPGRVKELLRQQEEKLDRLLCDLRTAYSIIHTFSKNIETGLSAQTNEICVLELAEEHYITGCDNDWSGGHDSWYQAFIDFCLSADDNRINLRYPIGAIHQDMDAFLNAPGKPVRFFSQDPLGNRIRKAGSYLVGYHRGYYGVFGDLPERMAAYARKHRLDLSGPVFTSYPLDEISIIEHDKFVSQIVVKVSEEAPT